MHSSGRLIAKVAFLVSTAWGCLGFAGTVAYWEFDAFTEGMTPAAVGGAAMDLRTAGEGADFERVETSAVEAIPCTSSSTS